MRSQIRVGRVMRAVFACVAGLGAITAAVFGFIPASARSAPHVRLTQPRELGALLRLIDLDPEALAAAGLSSTDCAGVFNAMSAYCIQADRMAQFQQAHRALNQAKARVTKPPAQTAQQTQANNNASQQPAAPPPPTVVQTQGVLDDLKTSTFNFVTTGLAPEQIATLNTIRANRHWGVPAPYLVVSRTQADWIALRKALTAKRIAVREGTPLAAAPAAVIAAADSDPAIAAAKAATDSGLAVVRQSWAERSGDSVAE